MTCTILEIIQRNADNQLHAAEEIAAKFTELRDLLEELADIQNGPPLERYAKEWRELMDKIYTKLKETA